MSSVAMLWMRESACTSRMLFSIAGCCQVESVVERLPVTGPMVQAADSNMLRAPYGVMHSDGFVVVL